MNSSHFSLRHAAQYLAVTLFLLTGVGCASNHGPETFDSPDAATLALVSAARTNDTKALHRILGKQTDDVLSSGDDVADQQRMEIFVNTFDQKHHFETVNPNHVTLVVGEKDWPMPIPIVRDSDNAKWYFDTDAGLDELLSRRIGRNELDVIQVCQAIVDAQKEYARRDPDHDGIPEYAKKFLSDPGKKNGLYWATKEGEPPSPLGQLVSAAVDQGYSSTPNASHEPQPYHGYYYHMLESQGPDAPGGALDYNVQGKFIGGFAVIAYPADYANSGLKTFIINYDGLLYEKDLGDDTEKLAKAITSYNPDSTWHKVEPQVAAPPTDSSP